MFGRRFRTKAELWYITKYQLKNFPAIIIFASWSTIMLLSTAVIQQTWQDDFPNWYGVLIGLYVGVSVAIGLFFKAKKSQEQTQQQLDKIEMLLSKQFQENSNPKILKLILFYALSDIIHIFPEIEKTGKRWRKTKKSAKKDFFEEKIKYYWKNTILESSKKLEDFVDEHYVIYPNEEITKIKEIADKCKILPEFDQESNKVIFHQFHRTVIDCILLIDKLKIDSKFREDILKY